MLEPAELLSELIGFFQPKTLATRRVVITAGPTSEPIDPVRVMTNRSSGKTGYAIAQAAQQAGAEVILISGPTALDSPYGVERINVQTAKEMHAAVMSQGSEEHTSELQSLMRISYAVFCLKQKKQQNITTT